MRKTTPLMVVLGISMCIVFTIMPGIEHQIAELRGPGAASPV